MYDQPDTTTPEWRPWRTQVHVLDVDRRRGVVTVQRPGWHSADVITLPLDRIPEGVRSRLARDVRCHAHVNLGADTADQLVFVQYTGH